MSGIQRDSRFLDRNFPVTKCLLTALALSALSVASDRVFAQPSVQQQTKVHAGLYELDSWDEDGSVWVAAVGSRLVSGAQVVQLDAQSLEVKRAIDMGDAAGFGLEVNNRTGMLYTSNTRTGSMSAVNLETGEITVITNPEADGEPHLYEVVVDEESNTVYASVAQTPGQVWVIDGATNTLDRVIDAGGSRPTGIVVDSVANRLYVSNMGDDFVSVVDLSNDEVVARIPTVGTRSTRLAHDPATGRLFVGNQDSDDVSVIDLNEMRAVRRVPVGDRPVGVAFHAAENQIYVANRESGTVSVIDAETYESVAELEIGTYPNTVHINDKTGLVYVSNKSARTPRGEEPKVDPRGDMVAIIRP